MKVIARLRGKLAMNKALRESPQTRWWMARMGGVSAVLGGEEGILAAMDEIGARLDSAGTERTPWTLLYELEKIAAETISRTRGIGDNPTREEAEEARLTGDDWGKLSVEDPLPPFAWGGA